MTEIEAWRSQIAAFNLLLILLDDTYGRAGTKLLNTLTPLIREKLFVHDDHRAVAEFTGYGQGYSRLAEPTR